MLLFIGFLLAKILLSFFVIGAMGLFFWMWLHRKDEKIKNIMGDDENHLRPC